MPSNALKYSEMKPDYLEKYSPADTLVSGNPKQLLETYFVDRTKRVAAGRGAGDGDPCANAPASIAVPISGSKPTRPWASSR